MANRRFQRLQALEREVKVLHAKLTTDGSGDVTAVDGLGIDSASHAADVYTITLDDNYVDLLHVNVISGVASTVILSDESVSTDKEIELTFGTTQASTDIRVELHLKNSSVK